MKNVRILYNNPHFRAQSFKPLEAYVSTPETAVDISLCKNVGDLFNKLNSKLSYDMVILHLMNEDDSGTTESVVKRIRSLHEGLVIAESSHHAYGRGEILNYFDDYVGIILNPGNLHFILEKYGFLHSK